MSNPISFKIALAVMLLKLLPGNEPRQVPEKDVFGDAEVRGQHQLLINDADAQLEGNLGAGDFDDSIRHPNLAGVPAIGAG